MPKIHQNDCELRKLLSKLRSCGFKVSGILIPRFLEADPWIYVPVYQYLFFEYKSDITHKVAQAITPNIFVSNCKHKKTSIAAIYKILRDVFSYSPPLTVDQFTSNRYAKQKITMCLNVVEMLSEETHLRSGIQQPGDGPGVAEPSKHFTQLLPCIDPLTGDAVQPPITVKSGSYIAICPTESDVE